ncbi:DUF5067 domain-containing protein, partial [Dysosmobacter welbionis]
CVRHVPSAEKHLHRHSGGRAEIHRGRQGLWHVLLPDAGAGGAAPGHAGHHLGAADGRH